MERTIKISLFVLILIWCLGIFSEWLVPLNQKIVFAIPWLTNLYSLVCHQLPDRLIRSGNLASMVCARCVGIYVGLLTSSFILIFIGRQINPKTKYLYLASIPLLTDVLFHSINIYQYSKTIAFCTGFLLGSTGFLYLYSALNQFFLELMSNKA